MGWDEREDSTVYRVVVNIEEQYSIWPVDRELALGWNDTGKRGLKTEVLAWIDVVWSLDNRRPLSLRKKMAENAVEDTRGYQAVLDLYAGGYYPWLLEREVPVGFRGTGKTGLWNEVNDWIRQMPTPGFIIEVGINNNKDAELYRAIYTTSSPANDGVVYILWPVNREMPAGYSDTGRVGPKPEILAWIMEVWHQVLPSDTQPYQAVIGPPPANKYLAWPRSTAVSYPFRRANFEGSKQEVTEWVRQKNGG
jgi:MbtH protein